MSNIQKQEPLLISREQAETLLQPYFPQLRKIVMDAWAEWERIPDDHRSKCHSRARANCVSDFMEHFARVHFSENAEVVPLERRGLFLIGIANEAVIRLKKFRSGRRISNIPTKQQIAFNLQLELPGIPKAVRLNVGYLLDITQTKIKDILVTLQHGRTVMWHFSIADQQSTVISMPLPLTMPKAPKRAKVKVRKAEEKTNQ